VASTKAAELLNNMQLEDPVNMDDMGIPEINTIILLDREVDMVTAMCSQLTYEGLLDEVDKSFSSWHRSSLDNENMICLCFLLRVCLAWFQLCLE